VKLRFAPYAISESFLRSGDRLHFSIRGDPSHDIIVPAVGNHEMAAPINRYSERVREYCFMSRSVGEPDRPGSRDRYNRPDRVASRYHRTRLNQEIDY
jgi:hypothetical protein